MEVKISRNLIDSMSFYVKTKNENELNVVTKNFDRNRDYRMTHFWSNMISNLVYYTQISMYKEKEKTKDQKIAIVFLIKEK